MANKEKEVNKVLLALLDHLVNQEALEIQVHRVLLVKLEPLE